MMVIHQEKCDSPTEPGWYIARMKSWPLREGYAAVRVTQHGTADPLLVWQAADVRPWGVENWEWKARIWP